MKQSPDAKSAAVLLVGPVGSDLHTSNLKKVTIWVSGVTSHEVVPGRLQSTAEIIYTFVRKMVIDIAGQDGLKYFPYSVRTPKLCKGPVPLTP